MHQPTSAPRTQSLSKSWISTCKTCRRHKSKTWRRSVSSSMSRTKPSSSRLTWHYKLSELAHLLHFANKSTVIQSEGCWMHFRSCGASKKKLRISLKTKDLKSLVSLRSRLRFQLDKINFWTVCKTRFVWRIWWDRSKITWRFSWERKFCKMFIASDTTSPSIWWSGRKTQTLEPQ